MADQEFNPSEFAATLERISAGRDAAHENPQPRLDTRQQLELRTAAAEGRQIGAYRLALENLGFTYYTAEYLTQRTGVIKTEGEWRCGRLKLAFTDWDLRTSFRGPEDFYRWVVEYEQAKNRQAARLFSHP